MRYVVGSIFMETNADLDPIRDLKKEIEALVYFIIIDMSVCVCIFVCVHACVFIFRSSSSSVCLCAWVRHLGSWRWLTGAGSPTWRAAQYIQYQQYHNYERNVVIELEITETTQNNRMGMTISKNRLLIVVVDCWCPDDDVDNITIEVIVVAVDVVNDKDYNIQGSMSMVMLLLMLLTKRITIFKTPCWCWCCCWWCCCRRQGLPYSRLQTAITRLPRGSDSFLVAP